MAETEKKVLKEITMDDFFNFQVQEQTKELTKADCENNEPNPIINLFNLNTEIKENVSPKGHIIDFFNNSNKEVDSINNTETSTTLLKSIEELIQKVEGLNKTQNELAENIEAIKSGKPSNDLVTFFKHYKYNAQSVFKTFIDIEVTSVLDSLKNNDFKKKLKLIPKSDDEKLKSELKLYKSLLNEQFLNKIREKENLSVSDETYVFLTISKISGFVSKVNYHFTENQIGNNPEI